MQLRAQAADQDCLKRAVCEVVFCLDRAGAGARIFTRGRGAATVAMEFSE